MYIVSYGNLGGLFIEAIKEQQAHIEELKTKNEMLEQKVKENNDLLHQLINKLGIQI
jgi:1,2-phenylacetyl-CoA epoxidase catalytic subunit